MLGLKLIRVGKGTPWLKTMDGEGVNDDDLRRKRKEKTTNAHLKDLVAAVRGLWWYTMIISMH